jgi:hypothetical protein
LFVVPIEDVVAVFRKVGKSPRRRAATADEDEVDDVPHLDEDFDE